MVALFSEGAESLKLGNQMNESYKNGEIKKNEGISVNSLRKKRGKEREKRG